MATTTALQIHHKHCDELFADAEDLVRRGEWQKSAAQFARFRGELEAHFESEEQTLFPALESATGMSGGPTQVMRYEHQQMRALLDDIAEAMTARQGEAAAALADTLLVMMQQHNLKEEHILYPMCDRTLAGGALDMAADLNRRVERACAA